MHKELPNLSICKLFGGTLALSPNHLICHKNGPHLINLRVKSLKKWLGLINKLSERLIAKGQFEAAISVYKAYPEWQDNPTISLSIAACLESMAKPETLLFYRAMNHKFPEHPEVSASYQRLMQGQEGKALQQRTIKKAGLNLRENPYLWFKPELETPAAKRPFVDQTVVATFN